MKILYYVRPEKEYGSEVIFDGLCKIGEEVLEYPQKVSLHCSVTDSRYPCFFDYPIVKTDAEKIEMLKNNEFDVILVGCRTWPEESDRFKGEFYELLKEKSKTIPTFIIDQGDTTKIREELMLELNARVYFKREYLGESNATPLSYSYPEDLVPKNIHTERTIPLFWAGARNSYRKPFLDVCGSSNNIFPQEKYRKKLLQTNIGLNLRGFGYDTVRHYEIPAHGAMLLSQRLPIIIKNEFVDGESAVFFDTPEELKEKLDYLLAHPEYVDKIRFKGYEHFLKYHTNTVRATQLMEKIHENI